MRPRVLNITRRSKFSHSPRLVRGLSEVEDVNCLGVTGACEVHGVHAERQRVNHRAPARTFHRTVDSLA